MKNKIVQVKTNSECCCEHHRRYGGLKMVILGLLVLGNIQYAWLGWPAFIGALIALAGAGQLLTPMGRCR